MKRLVAFYSRADENYFGGNYRYVEVGNTEKVAERIARLTDADLFKIEQKVPYSADYRQCVAQVREDLKNNARPELADCLENLDEYDEIFLGYPNYCGKMPMAVYSFLEKYDWTGKKIFPFCTHEGSGISGTVKEIEKSAPGAEVKEGLAVHGSSVDESGELIDSWVKK